MTASRLAVLLGMIRISILVLFLASNVLFAKDKPNVILMMCDDLGWGDVGFNGGKKIKTPQLDKMAAESLVFDRFYAQSAVCSPTRGSVVTGRHPYRYGIVTANKGHIKKEEFTIYEALKSVGYRTGHFGKWHLGTLTTKKRDSNRGNVGNTKDYAPPWENGVDVTFATEAKTPTYDPMLKPAAGGNKNAKKKGKRKGQKDAGDFRTASKNGWWPIKDGAPSTLYGTYYWTGEDQMVDPKMLRGDDSKLIVNHAVKFIEDSVKKESPFLAVVWFHAPHLPVVAGKEHTDLYKDAKDGFHANYFGCVTAVDDQVGRIRKTLHDLGASENTIVTFCSDNGPEGNASSPGRASIFKGRKRSLYEGGVRVPGLIEWPAKIKPSRTNVIACTSDYFPTLQSIAGFNMPDKRPIDGVDLTPLFEGKMEKRERPIGCQYGGQESLTDNKYKIYKTRSKKWELYDIVDDPSESKNLASANPEILQGMIKVYEAWKASCKQSAEGKDYSSEK